MLLRLTAWQSKGWDHGYAHSPDNCCNTRNARKSSLVLEGGLKDTKVAIVLPSWQEAIDHCSAPEWEDLCLEATNQYCERIVERSLDRWRQWNQTVDEVKWFTEPLVSKKITRVVERHRFPRVFHATVSWDILFICMEAEYSDVFPTGFYADQVHWYVRGHFPCGWEGELPKGRYQ
jgi:hypothetical protein